MVLRLIREHGEQRVTDAVHEALKSTSPRFDTVLLCLTRTVSDHVPTVPVADPQLAVIEVAAPILHAYDAIVEGGQ